MRQESGASEAAGDRASRSRSLHDLLAGSTGELGSYVSDHLVAAWHVLEHLAHIFSEPAQGSATGGTAARGLMNDILAREMRGQWTPRRLRRSFLRWGHQLGRLLRKTRLEILESELHLGNLGIELLGRAAIAHPLQGGDLEAQLLELELLGDDESFGGFECDAVLEYDAL
jgi:hypothetical protein